jgi:hypothetical protein
VVASPNVAGSDNRLTAIDGLSANDVWSVGFSGIVGVSGQTLVEHWDGTSWTIVPSPNNGVDSEFKSVVALSPNRIWAVGKGGNAALSEVGNAQGWRVVPTPLLGEGSFLDSLSASRSGTLWAAGMQTQSSEQLILMMPR